MQKISLMLGVACAALGCLLPESTLAQAGSGAVTTAAARVIVKFRADSGLVTATALAATSREASRAQALGERVGIAMDAGRAPVGSRAGGCSRTGHFGSPGGEGLPRKVTSSTPYRTTQALSHRAQRSTLCQRGRRRSGRWSVVSARAGFHGSRIHQCRGGVEHYHGQPERRRRRHRHRSTLRTPRSPRGGPGRQSAAGYCRISDPRVANNATCRGPDASIPATR